MNVFLFIGITLFLSTSCQSESSDCEISVSLHYTDKGSSNSVISYAHYLILENYEDERFNQTFFIKLANNYIDTASIDKPIGAIYFSKPNPSFDTSGDPDYLHWEKVREGFILSIDFSKKSLSTGEYKISSITVWEDGDPKNIYLE